MKKFRKKLKELGLDTCKQYLESGYWQAVKLKFKNSHFKLEDKKWRESQGKTRAERRKNKNIVLESSKEYCNNRSKGWLNYKKETFKNPTVYY